jgi:hypothetical protein
MDHQLVCRASKELEDLRTVNKHIGAPFPPAARKMLLSLAGNSHCVDCGSPHPEWCSLSFGCLLCLQCSGRHRSYGVQTSFVRSLRMDSWTHTQVLAMLEGGNEQLQRFFERHEMGSLVSKRYHTKAAQFYRTHLGVHVEAVSEAGVYQGREASRGRQQSNDCAQETPTEQPSSMLRRQVSAVQ